ncbi:MAG: type IV pili methyl-accepting chemotaxis transducer N-terminal domain-containing protein [Sedimentitalea sp.]
MFIRTAILALIGASLTLISSPAYAETPTPTPASFVEDVGASERINFSGKLRMLSQRIPSAACNAFSGIEPEKATAQLAAATAEFELILNGLQFGEAKLNMKGEESDRKVLIDIAKVREHWGPLQTIAQDIVDNGGTEVEITEIAERSAPLLGAAKHLVSVLVGEYSDPTALLQADALTIDIAGRQRMLAQRISKNVCLASSRFSTELALKELAGARNIYDASVRALRFGMPNAGITATTNPDILAGLDSVLALWEDIQPVLDSVAAGENISDENRARIFLAMNSLTGQMNKLVGTYNDDSKLGL